MGKISPYHSYRTPAEEMGSWAATAAIVSTIAMSLLKATFIAERSTYNGAMVQ